MKSFLIYCLKEPDTGEIRYFGKTCQTASQRFWRHAGCKTETHVARWVQKLRASSQLPEMEVLLRGLTNLESIDEEKALIAWGRKKGLRLTNLTDGGDGRLGFVVSDETKKKISIGHLGMRLTEETKQKLREANLGKKQSEETISKRILRGVDHWTFGKSRSIETREKISRSLAGYKQSEEVSRKRIALLPRGDKHWSRSKGMSVETRKKMSDAAKARHAAMREVNNKLT